MMVLQDSDKIFPVTSRFRLNTRTFIVLHQALPHVAFMLQMKFFRFQVSSQLDLATSLMYMYYTVLQYNITV